MEQNSCSKEDTIIVDQLSRELLSAVERNLPVEELLELAPGITTAEKLGYIARCKRGFSTTPVEVKTERPVPQPRYQFDLKGKVETVCTADWHVPFHRPDLIEDISHRHDGGILVVAGDLCNFHAQSKFISVRTSQSREPEQYAMEQLDTFCEIIQRIENYWTQIVIIRGNHDYRVLKGAAAVGKGDATLVDYGFNTKVKSASTKVIVPSKSGEDYYSVKVGDAWYGHWAWSGQSPCFGVKRVIEKFLPNPLISEQGKCRVVVQAHSHHSSECFHHFIWAVECGALCKMPDYINEGFGKGGTPELGYAVIVQEDGHLVQHESRLVKYGPEVYTRDLSGRSLYENTFEV